MPLWMSPSTACTASERKPSDRIASSTPYPCSQSSMKLRNGRPASGITGLGTVSVSGRRRVPSPPASTSACTARLPADALVGEARRGEQLAVEEVAAVDDERALHRPVRRSPVEVPELRPFGDQHGGVGAL